MTKLSELKGWLEDKKVEYCCMCDCLPCKTDSCAKCNLETASKGRYRNNELCKEYDNSEGVEAANRTIKDLGNLSVELDVEAVLKALKENILKQDLKSEYKQASIVILRNAIKQGALSQADGLIKLGGD